MLFLMGMLLIATDQFTKYLAVVKLKTGGAISIIGDFLQLDYVENYGAGFGILQNQKVFLILLTGVIILGLIVFLYRNVNRMNSLARVSFVLLIGGSLGNLIDRIRLGYVVDFISVRFKNGYDFPVFNMADVFVVVGTVLLILILLTDKDFDI